MFSVQRSHIHGKGCIAKVDLTPGIYIPVPFSTTKVETEHTLADEDGIYELYAPFKFLNHSDEPNAAFEWWDDCLYLTIIELVKTGEEVVIDYGEDWWEEQED